MQSPTLTSRDIDCLRLVWSSGSLKQVAKENYENYQSISCIFLMCFPRYFTFLVPNILSFSPSNWLLFPYRKATDFRFLLFLGNFQKIKERNSGIIPQFQTRIHTAQLAQLRLLIVCKVFGQFQSLFEFLIISYGVLSPIKGYKEMSRTFSLTLKNSIHLRTDTHLVLKLS